MRSPRRPLTHILQFASPLPDRERVERATFARGALRQIHRPPATAVIDWATKLIVVVSVATALTIETFLTARAWPGLVQLTGMCFLATLFLSLLFGELSAALVMLLLFVTPALTLVLHGYFYLGYGAPWVAALLGAILPGSLRTRWAVPGRWKAGILIWAMTIACTWPIVALRELDFTPALLNQRHLFNSTTGLLPPIALAWICDVAVTLGVGILWLDWLFAVFASDERRFRSWVLFPLGGGWAVMVGVGIYQLFGDMLFLNVGLFGMLGRASGTLRDANPFGMAAALGGPACIAAAFLSTTRRSRVVGLCGWLASWLGLWASASRAAFAAGSAASLFLFVAVWYWLRGGRSMSRRAVALIAASTIAMVAVLTLVVLYLPATAGPLPRIRSTLPLGSIPIANFITAMWNRDGYGLVSTHLIKKFPLFGVGIGSFHLLVSDYHLVLRGYLILGDNAQNWFRHQLAEMGVFGSIGWILWVCSFAWYLVSSRAPQATRAPSLIVKGLLVTFALSSMVGIPTMSIALTMGFWTLTYWCVALVGLPGSASQHQDPVHLGAKAWLAIGTTVALSAGGTAYAARHELRVPQRAVFLGWPYQHGFTEAEENVRLADHSRVWTGRHAVAVLAPNTSWVKLTFMLDALNVAKGPVDVKVWCDDTSVVDGHVNDVSPITRYVKLREGQKRMLLETSVSRTVRPSDFGAGDDRVRGLLVEGEFVQAPPDGAR